MQAILLSSKEVAKRAKELYKNGIRQQVDTEENIGKMIIIDIETGEYAIDKTGIESAHYLRNKNPLARLYGFVSATKLLFLSVVTWSVIISDKWYYQKWACNCQCYISFAK